MKNNFFNPQLNIGARLSREDTFCFDCHPGLACFTRCCQDADMYLYPYDIIRMKRRLGLASELFLQQYALTAFRDNPFFPSIMLKMSDKKEKACPFLTANGCTIYEDRPFSCRAYPLERAVARMGDNKNPVDIYFISNHAYCLGHQEARQWTVQEWLADQQIQLFNDMNDLWVPIDTLLRKNPWGPQGVDSPALKMAFMAAFNVDKFRTFVFESTFLSRLDVTPERKEQMEASDVELMKFGFDWIKFFLTGTGPLTSKS